MAKCFRYLFLNLIRNLELLPVIKPLSVILILIIFVGCAGIKPERNITGRVFVNGVIPDRAITVDYRVNGIKKSITTDADGYYTIASTAYYPGDQVAIKIQSAKSYSHSETTADGLNSWTYFNTFTAWVGIITLPPLDLYNYGVGFIKPEAGEVIPSFPYEVQFGEYGREVSQKRYYLFFYDDNDIIGYSEPFNMAPFNFDGNLSNGQFLSTDVYWAIEVTYQEKGFTICTISDGEFINIGA